MSGIPITVRTNPNGYGPGVDSVSTSTLCGLSYLGMRHTPDIEIHVRKALEHADTCEMCKARWAYLNTPGATLVSTGPVPAADAVRGDEGYAHEDTCRCYDCRPGLHED